MISRMDRSSRNEIASLPRFAMDFATVRPIDHADEKRLADTFDLGEED